MSSTSPTCPRCRVRLEKGFTLDQSGPHHRESTSWASGEYWSFMLGQEKVLTIETWRCPECGLLQSFARENASELAKDTTVASIVQRSDNFANSESETCSAAG